MFGPMLVSVAEAEARTTWPVCAGDVNDLIGGVGHRVTGFGGPSVKFSVALVCPAGITSVCVCDE